MRPAAQLRRLLCAKYLAPLLCLPAAGSLYLLSHNSTAFAEFWARYVYRAISHVFHAVSRLFPFSAAEIIVLSLPVLAVIFLTVGVVHVVKSRGMRLFVGLRAFVMRPLAAASILLLVFMINCGINYSRIPFSQSAGLTVRSTVPLELQSLCIQLLESANALRNDCTEDADGVMCLTDSVCETGKKAQQAFAALGETYPALGGGYGAPKPVLASYWMSYLDITGVFFPFTMEANVNVDVVDYNIPVTMCHELSHLRGYMPEDEANFIAYLACCASQDTDLRYSGTLLAFIHSINALGRYAPSLTGAVYAKMSDGVRRDLNANNAYWKQFETPVADISNSVNNAYLQFNGTPDGIESYGRMVDLLLAWRRSGSMQFFG